MLVTLGHCNTSAVNVSVLRLVFELAAPGGQLSARLNPWPGALSLVFAERFSGPRLSRYQRAGDHRFDHE
jgi:hypothetical protein